MENLFSLSSLVNKVLRFAGQGFPTRNLERGERIGAQRLEWLCLRRLREAVGHIAVGETGSWDKGW